MDTIKSSDVLRTYQRIDLYRAKYRHNDFTPHAWCFHGNKEQGWNGKCSNGRLVAMGASTTGSVLRYNRDISIDASIYKYITMNIGIKTVPPTSGYSLPASDTYMGMYNISSYLMSRGVASADITYRDNTAHVRNVAFAKVTAVNNGAYYTSSANLDIAWKNYIDYLNRNTVVTVRVSYRVGSPELNQWRDVEKLIRPTDSWNTVLFDMSEDANWKETVTGISISFSDNVITPLSFMLEIRCEYIKIDKDNVFQNIGGRLTTVTDFNEMREDVEAFAKQEIKWTNPGGIDPNRVRQHVDTIDYYDLKQVNDQISKLKPYNNCYTCDNFECQCNTRRHGHNPCATCDGCNAYISCSVCNGTCHQEARKCACYGTCYTQGRSCSCNQTCYTHAACRCNQTKYTGAI